MSTIHSVDMGIVNLLIEKQKALTSGMYLTFYYLGGALGSLLPAIIYEEFGRTTVICIFLASLLLILILLYKNKRLWN